MEERERKKESTVPSSNRLEEEGGHLPEGCLL